VGETKREIEGARRTDFFGGKTRVHGSFKFFFFFFLWFF
jgi:hypothetical protein